MDIRGVDITVLGAGEIYRYLSVELEIPTVVKAEHSIRFQGIFKVGQNATRGLAELKQSKHQC